MAKKGFEELVPPARGYRANKASLEYYVERWARAKGIHDRQRIAALAEATRPANRDPETRALSESSIRNILKGEQVGLRTIQRVAHALGVTPGVITEIDGVDFYDLVAGSMEEPDKDTMKAIGEVISGILPFFKPVLKFVHPHELPEDSLHPRRLPFGGTRADRPKGYALLEVRFDAPAFEAIASYSIGGGPLRMWIDYGTLSAQATDRFSMETWIQRSARKRDETAGRMRFMTWFDAFPEAFMLRSVEASSEVELLDVVDLRAGERLLDHHSDEWVGFRRTFHPV